jgi:putative ABC transport system ATP-binding protein
VTPVLDIRGLRMAYDGEPILRELSLDLAPGRHLLLLGPSGSGKSTLIGLIAGLLTPDAGEILIAGEPMTGRSAAARDGLRRRRIGLVLQTLRLVSALSVRSNLRLAQKLGQGRTDDTAIDELLETLGIAHRAAARPRQLSQGEAQRAAIARALVGRPDLLLADEPTSALDDANAERIALLLLETARAQGTSLLIATHDQRLKRFIPASLSLGPAEQEAA